jgi:hypothetical protein
LTLVKTSPLLRPGESHLMSKASAGVYVPAPHKQQ